MTKRVTSKGTVKATNSDTIIDLAESGLTLKRQAFIRAYLENGGNASAAYRNSR